MNRSPTHIYFSALVTLNTKGECTYILYLFIILMGKLVLFYANPFNSLALLFSKILGLLHNKCLFFSIICFLPSCYHFQLLTDAMLLCQTKYFTSIQIVVFWVERAWNFNHLQGLTECREVVVWLYGQVTRKVGTYFFINIAIHIALAW